MKEAANNADPFSENGNVPRGLVWDDARAFLAVARLGTLSAAASQLNIGLATLSRRIDRLEAALALPLFLRQQTGYRLTDDGARLMGRAEAMEAAAGAFASGAQGREALTGRVRLATAEGLATGLILPALPGFRTRHPGLTIDVMTRISTVNIHRRDADLALRMVRPERGHVTVRRLGVLGYGVYGSAEYLAMRKGGGDRGLREDDAFIGWGEVDGTLPAAVWGERMLRGRAPTVTTTSLATQLAAASAGLGLAVLPHFLAHPAGLVCLNADPAMDQPIFLVIQSDLVQSRRVRLLADFLADLVIQNRDALAGG